MTIIELTGINGQSIYVVCEQIASIQHRNDGSLVTGNGGLGILAEVIETPLQIIALITDAMS